MLGKMVSLGLFVAVAFPAVAWVENGSGPDTREKQTGQLAVRVVSTDGEPIATERYVAVVPFDAPWASPTAEVLATEGEPVPVFEVAPGDYRVFCSAEGFSFLYGGRAVVPEGASVVTSCELPPVLPREGRVVSAVDGTAVPGARVGPAGWFAPCHVRELSAIGARHVRRQHLVQADETGTYSLPMPERSLVPLWVEAPGFSPVYLPSFGPSDAGQLPLVRLEPGGGSLEVALSYPEGFPKLYYQLHLTPAKGWGDRESPRLPAYLLHLPCCGEGVLRWTSLPADSYRVWLKGPAEGDHDLLPIELGSARVVEGHHVRFEAVVPGPAAGQAEPKPEAPQVRLMLRNEAADEWPSAQVVHWDGRRVIAPAASARQVSGGVMVHVDATCSAGDTYVAVSPTRVSAPLTTTTTTCGPATGLIGGEAAQAAEVRGRLSPPPDGAMPRTCLVNLATISDRGRRAPALLGIYPTTVEADGRWSAQVPAGAYDLVLRTGDYAAYMTPGARLEPRPEVNDLGEQQLDHGAALLARVIDGASGLPLTEALVEVFPAEAARPVASDVFEGRVKPGTFSATTNLDGWVRFPGLDANRIFLRVSGPWPIPWLSQEIVLAKGREVLLDPVEALPPGALEVRVDAEDPDVLERLGDLELHVHCGGECGPLGATSMRYEMEDVMFVVESLQPALWELRLWVVGDGRLNQVSDKVNLRVEPGQIHEATIPIEGQLYDVRVTFRGEPVGGAHVNFYPWQLNERVLPRMVTDDEGRFSLFLERPGRCAVEVMHPRLLGGTKLPPVEFDDPARTVEIRLPEGRIQGTVVDSSGEPVQLAFLDAYSELSSKGVSPSLHKRMLTARASTNSDGSFVLDRLAAGSWTVEARQGDRRSDTRLITLAEDEVLSGVEIVVEDQVVIRGRVMTEAGTPVTGALMITLPPSQPGGLGINRLTELNQAGHLELRLTAQQAEVIGRQPVNLVAGGEAAPLTALRRTLSDGSVIKLPVTAGSVELSVAGGTLPDILDGLALVNTQGAFFTLRTALNSGSLDTEHFLGEPNTPNRLQIRTLAAGTWSIVSAATPASRYMLANANGLSLPALATFSCTPGSRAEAEVRPPWVLAQEERATHQPWR